MRFLTAVFVLLVCAATVAFISYLLVEDYYETGFNNNKPSKTIIVKKGVSINQVAAALGNEKVIRHPKIFSLVARYKKQTNPKFGEYSFRPGMSPKRILEMLESGETVIRKIAIPEGRTVWEIREILRKLDGITGEIPDDIPEGSLLPTTYYYHWGDSYAEIIERMQKEMTRTLDELWEKRQEGLPVNTKEEALILASIVEKETGIASERKLVASVFVNRLRKGMRLESDPTAVYGITKGEPLGRVPLRKDVRDQNPFNTYVIDRLPPTPITNPGRDSIEAALNPDESDYIFFVATGNGGHNFSTNLNDHNRFVNEYRKIIREYRNATRQAPEPAISGN